MTEVRAAKAAHEVTKAQLDERQAKVEQLRAPYQLKKAQLASLQVRAGVE